MTNAQQTTKSNAAEMARNFVTLRDRGLSVSDALDRIATDSNTDTDTVLVAIHYALAA